MKLSLPYIALVVIIAVLITLFATRKIETYRSGRVFSGSRGRSVIKKKKELGTMRSALGRLSRNTR